MTIEEAKLRAALAAEGITGEEAERIVRQWRRDD